MDKLGPFDYVNAINAGKDLLAEGDDAKGYVPFLVNRALSFYPDSIMQVQEMNQRHGMPKEAQFSYLLNTIRPRQRRMGKWPKVVADERIDMLAKYYRCNRQYAKTILGLHTEDQLAAIRNVVCPDEEQIKVKTRRAKG
jgi:hypothetical protein